MALISFAVPFAGGNASAELSPSIHIPLAGQSLSGGWKAQPPINTTNVTDGSFMLGDSVRLDDGYIDDNVVDTSNLALNPLVETNAANVGETYASALVAQVRQSFPDDLVVHAHGIGNRAIDELDKGTVSYNNGINAISRVRQLTQSTVPIMVFDQGENDELHDFDVGYLAELQQLIGDYNADIKAVTGQAGDVVFLLKQMSNHTKYEATPEIAPLQLEAHNTLANCVLVSPQYFLDFIDGTHLTPAASQKMGEYFGEAAKQILLGNGWEPLQPVSASFSANAITLTMSEGGLVLDDVAVTDPSNFGFELELGTIASVSVSGNEVTITTALPVQSGEVVRYAWTGALGADAGRTTGARGNLRTANAPNGALSGEPLYKWCVHFEVTL